ANKVQTDLNDCLEPCRLSYEQCNACIRGVIAREMEIVNTVDQSCRQKIEDALMFVWHDLVGAMNKIGVPPLTDSDIQTILAGGDLPQPIPNTADVPVDYQTPVTVTPIYTGPIT